MQVPYESLRFLFFGEEAFQLARLWAAGWDVFAPAVAVVFHQWSRAGRRTFQSEVPRVRACAQLWAPQLSTACHAVHALLSWKQRRAYRTSMWVAHAAVNVHGGCSLASRVRAWCTCTAWRGMLCNDMLCIGCARPTATPLQDAEAEAASRRRVAQLLSGEGGAYAAQPMAGSGVEAHAPRGVCALGAHCGVDFAARVMSERARRGGAADDSLFASS